jgi:predicted secreted Zn-dependent protease
VITLPALDDESVLSGVESSLWLALVAKLREFEDGHVNIYRAAAQELSNEIIAPGERPDCEQLRWALQLLMDAKLARIVAADRNFDLETGHGAVFPAQE